MSRASVGACGLENAHPPSSTAISPTKSPGTILRERHVLGVYRDPDGTLPGMQPRRAHRPFSCSGKMASPAEIHVLEEATFFERLARGLHRAMAASRDPGRPVPDFFTIGKIKRLPGNNDRPAEFRRGEKARLGEG